MSALSLSLQFLIVTRTGYIYLQHIHLDVGKRPFGISRRKLEHVINMQSDCCSLNEKLCISEFFPQLNTVDRFLERCHVILLCHTETLFEIAAAYCWWHQEINPYNFDFYWAYVYFDSVFISLKRTENIRDLRLKPQRRWKFLILDFRRLLNVVNFL